MNCLLMGTQPHQRRLHSKKNDVIVEIGGQPIQDIFDLKRELVANFDSNLNFVVERESGDEDNPTVEKVDIKVATNPMRETGLVMKWGPITAIQFDSPELKLSYWQAI